jgi:predicted MFS family arabinose efflux permease
VKPRGRQDEQRLGLHRSRALFKTRHLASSNGTTPHRGNDPGLGIRHNPLPNVREHGSVLPWKASRNDKQDMQGEHRRTTAIVLAAAALVLFVGAGARFAIGLTLKPVAAEFSGGRSLIGSAVLVFQIVSAVAMLIAGRMADRLDLRLVLGLGVLVASAGLGGLAFATTSMQLVALYGVAFGAGTGLASLIPVGVLVARSSPKRLGTANAIVLAGMGLGQLTMIAAFSLLLEDIGWRRVFLNLGLMHVVLLPVIFLAIPRSHAEPPGRTSGNAEGAEPAAASGLSLAEIFRSSRFWLLLAVYALCGFHDFFVTTHIVALAQDRGADTLLAGNLLALMGLAMVVGVLASGWVSDRTGPVAPTLAAFLLRIALFGAILWNQGTVMLAAFAVVIGATFLVTAPLCAVFSRDAFGTRNLGLVTGLITMVHHISGGIGGWLGAVWFDRSGSYDLVLAIMIATSLAGAALTPMLRSRRP